MLKTSEDDLYAMYHYQVSPHEFSFVLGPTSLVFFEHLGSSGTGMSGGIPLLLLYAVVACTVTTLPVLPLLCLHRNPYSAGRFAYL